LVRARTVLRLLESEQIARAGPDARGPAAPVRESGAKPGAGRDPETLTDQLTFFGPPVSPLVARLASLDPNTMTPIEALTLLATLAEEARRS
jgi:hypothetical protein